MPFPMHHVKLNFNGWFFDKLGQLEMGGTIVNHPETLVRALLENVGVNLTIEAKILALVQNLKVAKDEGISKVLVEGQSTLVLY